MSFTGSYFKPPC